MERGNATRERALLAQEINRWGQKLTGLGSEIQVAAESYDKIDLSINAIDGLVGEGGLERLKEHFVKYRSLSKRIQEIGQTLRSAGAE